MSFELSWWALTVPPLSTAVTQWFLVLVATTVAFRVWPRAQVLAAGSAAALAAAVLPVVTDVYEGDPWPYWPDPEQWTWLALVAALTALVAGVSWALRRPAVVIPAPRHERVPSTRV